MTTTVHSFAPPDRLAMPVPPGPEPFSRHGLEAGHLASAALVPAAVPATRHQSLEASR